MPSKNERFRSQTGFQTCNSNGYTTRRRILSTSGITIVGTLAGCTDLLGNETTPEEYEHLQQRPVYVAASVDLSIPDTVQTVDAPDDADLVVIPDKPNIEAPKAVEWLEQKRAIALLGEEAQSTWLSWEQSDAYVEAFDPKGGAEGDPEPNLLIAWYTGPLVTTQHYIWRPDPTDNEVLRALNDTLGDIEPRTG